MDKASIEGFSVVSMVLGLIGAALGVSYSPPLTRREVFAALLAGVACAALVPQALQAMWQLPPVVNNVAAFFVGIGGMFIVPGIIAIWRSFAADPWSVIDRVRGRRDDK